MWYPTKISVLLWMLVVFASATICIQADGTIKKEAYERLGEFFDQFDVGFRVEDYLELAKTELKWQNFNLKGIVSGYRAALKEIVRLQYILYRPGCDTHEYYMLKKIEEKIGYDHRYLTERETTKMKPLVFILHEVGKIRAYKCKRVWPRKFFHAYAKFNTTAAILAEFKRKPLQLVRHRLGKDYKYLEYILDYQLEKDPTGLEDAYLHLMRHSKADPQECRFHSMIDKYLRVPCQQYQEQLGFPILFQARYDGRLFYRYSNEIDMSPGLIPFYEAMLSDAACKIILNTDSKFSERIYDYWFEIQRKQRSLCYQLIENGQIV